MQHRPIRVTFHVDGDTSPFVAVIHSALARQYVHGKNAEELDEKLGGAIYETRKVLALAKQYEET